MTVIDEQRVDPGTDGWLTAPFFMLRTAGMPIDAADELAFTDSARWTRLVLDIERGLTDTGRILACLLGEAVARHLDDDRLRKRLINLRRDVFALRRPRGADAVVESGALDRDTLAKLGAWLADFGAWQRELAAGPDTFAAELLARRARLRELARTPDLRNGILLSSPTLDTYLPTYLDAPAGRLGKRARRIERSLTEYLLRTAGKTSPFSTFTTVNLGSYVDGLGVPLAVEFGGTGKRSRTRLNMAVLARLSTMAAADESIRWQLPVRATAGWQTHHDRIRYLRRQRTVDDDPDAAVTMEPVHETLFYLPTGPLLTDTLDLLGERGELRMAELAELLYARDGAGRTREAVAAYLGHLLRLGLLVVPQLQLDIHRPDPFARYRECLRELDRPWSHSLASGLAEVADRVDAYPAATTDGRRALLGEIATALAELHGELGHGQVAVPRTVLYEDATERTATVVGDRDLWERRLLPGLRDLGRILPMFDLNLGRRLVTKGFFVARNGSGGHCADFLSFAHEFQRDFFEHYTGRLMRRRAFDKDNRYVRQENWFKQPEIAALDEAREHTAALMNQRYARLPAGATELALDESFVDTVADLMPDSLGSLRPLSFFLQVADDGVREPLVVINRIYSGLTLLFSRFAHLFEDEEHASMVAGLRETLRRLRPDGAVFAELKGGYDSTNLNLHPRVTDYELVCPGELSTRPPDEQVPVEDLYIEHDERADRLVLRSRRLGVEIIPVYLGFLMPMALPEVQQVLLNFSYTSMAQFDLWSGTDVSLPGKTIACYPRITYRNVVLQRRMWKVHPDYLPRPVAGQGEERWFLDWARWREANGVPRHVFVTADAASRSSAVDGDAGAGDAPPEHKPLYVDFDNYFALVLLDAMARGADSRLVMTEMTPDHSELWLRRDGKRYVTELTVELDHVRRES
ncbi:lantibiotic dehydratase [Actinokineospora sp.]|uniref:lantibiotic dehydratase n=1 Tax=Actinokineospora sp. TaxID=1872133 RepID=UPI004037ED85